MRYLILLLFCLFSLSYTGFSQSSTNGFLQYVQPLVGTANSTTEAAVKHGSGTEHLANTIPAVGVPFGMTQWTPQTRTTEVKCLAPYYHKDTKISGFRGTHWLSGSCTQDYGSVTIMPLTGKLKTKAKDFATPYSHQNEISAPNYYKVNLNQYGVNVEMTALARSSLLQITIDKTDSLYILVMPNSDKGKGFIKIDRVKKEIIGYNPAYRIYQGLGKPAGFSGYFVIQLDQEFTTKGTFSNDMLYQADSLINKPNVGAYVGLRLRKGERVKLRVGTSFSSITHARKNLEAEVKTWDFNTVRQRSAEAWEEALSRIAVEGNDKRNKHIFYTAFYHSMQHPRLFSDVDGTFPKFAHQYELAQTKEAGYYDDFSMWDIYRAQLPLLEIIQPKLVNNFVSSLILKGQQGQWLPIFPCWNSFTGAMIGDHASAFISSAYLKGIKDYNIEEAYRLMHQNAFDLPSEADYKDGKGRRALSSYLKYHYVPLEDSVWEAFHKKEQVSRTLEYAYDDYALAMVAKNLGKEQDYKQLIIRAKNYQHVFDKSVGLVRGKYANGHWYSPFFADRKMPFITEGTPRQYTFYVPQDIPGLANLMGGTNKLEESLDELFKKGEYWHGNEPGHQIPFLYNFTTASWKTQREVRRILAEEYSDGPGGLSGNDDAGQMSVWYVFASIGLYPVDPVSGEYIMCAPLFDKITINLPDNKKLQIITHNQGGPGFFIQSIKLNDKPFTNNFIRHQNLVKGGKLEIYLADKPNLKWAKQVKNRPSGISTR